MVAEKSELECACMNKDKFTVLGSGDGRCHWASMCIVYLLHSKWLREYSSESASNFALSLNFPPRKLFRWFRRPQLWATGDWQLHHNNVQLMHHISLRDFWWNIKSHGWLSHPTAQIVPSNSWLFPKLRSPLKGKRFQTTDEIQENMTGQLMTIGRTVWGPKVPTLKGTEASFSYV